MGGESSRLCYRKRNQTGFKHWIRSLFAEKDVNQTFRLLQHILVSTTLNDLAKQQLVS